MYSELWKETELIEFIRKISPSFDESLTRAFKNETLAFHRQEDNLTHYALADVLHSVDETIIELRRLQLSWVPDFRISQLRTSLRFLCLDLHLNLGSLRIEGDYEANNAKLQAILPVTHDGKITIIFNNMAARAKVGLFISEDSLLPENYDTVYETGRIVVRVKYYSSGGQAVETEVTEDNVEETLGTCVWNQLTETLTELLDRQLKKVLSEFSLIELFGNMLEDYRIHEKYLKNRSNHLADEILCSAKYYIVGRHLRQLETPAFCTIFKKSSSQLHLGSLKTCLGYIEDLSTLTRKKDWNLYLDGNDVVIFGQVTIDDFRHGFRLYEATHESTTVSGSISMVVRRNKLLVKLKLMQRNDDCFEISLDKIRLVDIRNFEVDIAGLASLSWLMTRVEVWIIGTLHKNVRQVLERQIEKSFQHAVNVRNMDLLRRQDENLKK